MPSFADRVRELTGRAEGAGWVVLEARDIPYGRLVVFERGAGIKATLSCYHGKKGFKQVLGGKAAAELAGDIGGTVPGQGGRPSGAADVADPFELGVPRIGGDESGKGDYFGPLVVAAWHLVPDEVDDLLELGVADSKRLTDRRIETLAGRLAERGRGNVVVLDAAAYNAAYREVGNLNHLLAELHGRCVRGLMDASDHEARVVLIDRFTPKDALLRGHLPRGPRLETRTKGEADPAVAAASILARAAFVEGLRALSHEYGMTFPPGAGSPVLRAGRDFVRDFGAAALDQVAKVHFATSGKIT